ncbi:MAG: DUF4388 domain-containing protein, partial [Verrucomicrobiota bacterium]
RFPDKELLLTSKGRQGIDWIDRFKPSLVITDLHLPDVDGLQIVLKSVIKHPEVPALVVSGFVALEEVKEMTKGFENITFVSKPFQSQLLVEIINKVYSSDPDSLIRGMNLINLIQMIGIERKTCHLELAHDTETGIIAFEEGVLHFAASHNTVGKKALLEMLAWDDVSISVFNKKKTRRINVDEPMQKLIIELCQKFDEQSKNAPSFNN